MPDGATSPRGPVGLRTEAGAILRETLAREPWGVLRAAAANTVRQLLAARTGDTLGPQHLRESVARALTRSFPAAESRRFAASLQFRGALPAVAAPFLWPHLPVLLAGALALPLMFRRAWQEGDSALLGFLLCVTVGVLANAAVLGALSGPHDRYGARMAWLLPLAGLLAWRGRRGGIAAGGRQTPIAMGSAAP